MHSLRRTQGPRGRRLLPEYAIVSGCLHDPEYREDSRDEVTTLALNRSVIDFCADVNPTPDTHTPQTRWTIA